MRGHQFSWLTVKHLSGIINKNYDNDFKLSDLYRFALESEPILSAYFQSPIIIKEVNLFSKNTASFDISPENLVYHICHHNPIWYNYFEQRPSHTFADSEHKYTNLHCPDNIWDLSMEGNEAFLLRKLLNIELDIPQPQVSQNHCGIILQKNNKLYQLYEKCTYRKRLKKQLERMPFYQTNTKML